MVILRLLAVDVVRSSVGPSKLFSLDGRSIAAIDFGIRRNLVLVIRPLSGE